MRQLKFVLFLLFSYSMSIAQTQTVKEPPTPETKRKISYFETEELIKYLASDDLEGRSSGSQGFEQAAQYIEAYFKKNGIVPFIDSYREPYKYGTEQKFFNLIGLTKQFDPSQPTVIICAHLDHLQPKEKGKDLIYNGANDNASGVTAALQIAKYLAKNYEITQNVAVVLFSGEELGLIGSDYFVFDMDSAGIQPILAFNFEMIGTELTDRPNSVYMTGFDMSNMAQEINKALDKEFVVKFEQEKELKLFYRSDNASFYRKFKIPAHTFSSFDFINYNYYHEVDDEVENLDLENMNEIINNMAQAIEQILLTNAEIKLK